MENLLLPRSTGLLYSLRALLPHVPDLHLLDVTIVYPGKVLLACILDRVSDICA